MRIVVVFPEPLRPRKPKTHPRGTLRSKACTARFTPKYVPYNVVIGPDMKVLYSRAGFDAGGIEQAVAKAMAAAKDDAAKK